MNTPFMVRQGDVLFTQVAALPKGAKKDDADRKGGRQIIEYGEVTGHAHAFDAKVAQRYRWEGDKLVENYVVTEEGAQLKHEEHSTITFPKGVMKITRQREYSPEAIRFVQD